MPIDFPDNPTTSQSFTVGNRTWIFNGTVWESANARDYNRILSDTAPSNPVEGDEWFNTATSRLYAYYDGFWIEIGTSVQGEDGADGADGQDGESGLLPVVSVSSDITITANTRLFVDTTATRTLTLPATPALGDDIVIYDSSGQAATNNITLLRNGNLINGEQLDAIIDVDQSSSTFVYTGSSVGWRFE